MTGASSLSTGFQASKTTPWWRIVLGWQKALSEELSDKAEAEVWVELELELRASSEGRLLMVDEEERVARERCGSESGGELSSEPELVMLAREGDEEGWRGGEELGGRDLVAGGGGVCGGGGGIAARGGLRNRVSW